MFLIVSKMKSSAAVLLLVLMAVSFVSAKPSYVQQHVYYPCKTKRRFLILLNLIDRILFSAPYAYAYPVYQPVYVHAPVYPGKL